MFPKTVASGQALAEMFWQMAARIPPHAETSQVDGEATDQSRRRGRHHRPALPRNTWPRGIVERVYPGIDGQVRVVDIRTAHGRLRRPTARLAVLPTEVESSHAPTGRRGVRGGRTSHWPRGETRTEGGRARHSSAVICERGPPQSVRLQPPTRKHSLYSEF
ncbi:hypothetical protein EVAR_83017_1 [Eumeta japonica]|uniref:DUF5641 domain-containing protein n=1 Tax=Eumeta variegata TaxID=151549 RepID=A0A4C1T4S6_EUMVA|nr:hypothetical protein EVAR_83017_1 [Eumeta japonica]